MLFTVFYAETCDGDLPARTTDPTQSNNRFWESHTTFGERTAQNPILGTELEQPADRRSTINKKERNMSCRYTNPGV